MAKARHIYRTTVHGNPNVGLCGYATEEYCLIGAEFTEHQADEIEKILKVPVHRISMCGTALIGVFVAGNSNCLLVPNIAFDYELDVLKKLNINFKVFDTDLTALGNNILAGENGCIVNQQFNDQEVKFIEEALGVPATQSTVAGLDTVGVMCATTGHRGIINRDIKEKEKMVVEDVLDILLTECTVNIGTPQIRSGLFCNSNGFVIGETSSGHEITNIDEALGFIEVN